MRAVAIGPFAGLLFSVVSATAQPVKPPTRLFSVARAPLSSGLPAMLEGSPLPAAHESGPGASSRWWAPIASAGLPGAGQAALGERRGISYVALETYAWLQYGRSRREGNRRRREYQQLAHDVARAIFPGPRPVGDFEYYEHMLKNLESGEFDVMPGGELDPESDPTTFNGARWLEARRLFWESAEQPPPRDSRAYRDALAFYEQNAVRSEFRWSWRNAQLEKDLFRQTIVRSNHAFKSSTEYLGVLIANHALSAVDAYVSLRIRSRADASGRLGIEGSIPFDRLAPRRTKHAIE